MTTQLPPNSGRQHKPAPYPTPISASASNSNHFSLPQTPVRGWNVSSSTSQRQQFGLPSQPLPSHSQTGAPRLPRQATSTVTIEPQGGMTIYSSLRPFSNTNLDSTSDCSSDHTVATWVTEVDPIPIPVDDPSKITPPRARHLSTIATRLVHETPKSEQCIVIGVGDRQCVQDYAHRNTEGNNQMRRIHVRALLDLVQTALGYDALPEDKRAAKEEGYPSTVSAVMTEFIITRSEHLAFLRSSSQNIFDVRAIAKLQTHGDAKFLLTTLSLNRNDLNFAAHEINIRCAVDLIMWMRKESTKHIARTIGWPDASATQLYIDVFCTAVKALLPPACHTRSPQEAIRDFGDISLNNYVRVFRTHMHTARKLHTRTKQWGSSYSMRSRLHFLSRRSRKDFASVCCSWIRD
ncbi:hypothetical protein BGX38DRAFT_604681 [Terfezia claveryi]|nr:hypothetical protein BGX38DRAFT_604681 [Terfezia claveryi]